MKKSQSIFLLSGLVPLVAAPIAIVASCSSDSTATTFSLKTNVTLTDLTDEQKDPSQYAGAGADSKKKLADLIVAKKDQVFNNPPADLKAEQIQITNDVTANTNDGSLTFKLKVVSTSNPPADLIVETDVTLKGFTATQTPATPEQTLVNNAVAEIEKVYDAKTFKLKDDKKTLTQAEVDALKAKPSDFLTNTYTEGLPNLDQNLESTITANNFTVAPKQTGTKQQQPQQQTITLKVTVTHKTSKDAKDTKDLTFDFTLQANTAPAPAKQQTVAKETVEAATLGLNGKVDALEPTIDAAWVVTNIAKLVDGDQNVTKAADVIDLVKTKDNQDSTLLTIAFKLAADTYYLADGNPGKTESAVFTIKITGFQAAGAPLTVKKAEFNASELDPTFATKNFNDLNLAINKAQWLFDNREKYLDGDVTPETTFRNFVFQQINFALKPSDQSKATMRFSVAAGRTYNEKGVPTTAPTTITFDVVLNQ